MDQPPSPPKESRGPVSLRIKFRSASLDQFIERYAIDVSRGGIFIRTREPLAVGTQLRFDFQLQDAAPLLAGEGTVVWIRENDPNRAGVTPGMGVRFDKLTPSSQPTLERILAEKARREQDNAAAKAGQAGGTAARSPSSSFSALAPTARAPVLPTASEPPRMGGLSPLGQSAAPRPPQPPASAGLGAAPRAAQPPTTSSAMRTGAMPRAAQPSTGTDPLGGSGKAKTAENPVPQGMPTLESSGAFGRALTTTGMNAQRSVPAPSALFEKPTAEDIDRALSVLTEVDGPAPQAMPEAVDFSARFRRPTEPQATVPEPGPAAVSTTAAAAAIPSDLMKTVRRPTDAQPLILETAADVGDAPARRSSGTRPLYWGSNAGSSEQRSPTVPVVPLGGPPPDSVRPDYEAKPGQSDQDDEDGQTSAWQNSGPTRVGETSPELAAFMGSGDDVQRAAPPRADLPPTLPQAPPRPSLDASAPEKREPPAAKPAIMSPDFAALAAAATRPPPKRSAAPVIILLLLAAGGAGAYYVTKGGKPATTGPEVVTAPAEPAVVAPSDPTAAPAAGGEAVAGPEAAKPAEGPANEAKAGGDKAPEPATPGSLRARAPGEAPKEPAAEEKPAEASSDSKADSKSSSKERRSRRKSASEAAPPEAAPPAVADVSPGAGSTTAAEPPTSSAALKITTSPAGAEVIIDGSSVGKTPYVGSDIDPASPHAITLKKDGFEDHERMISGSDWPRAKAGVRTLKVNVKLRSTGGGEPAKPAEGGEAPPSEPPPGLGTTPTTPKRE